MSNANAPLVAPARGHDFAAAAPGAPRVTGWVVGPLQENTYLVQDPATGAGALVDPGAEGDALVAALRERERRDGLRLEAVWLTHAHLDHIGALKEVTAAWDVPVYLHPRVNPPPISTLLYAHAPFLIGAPQEFAVTLSTHILGLCTNGVFECVSSCRVAQCRPRSDVLSSQPLPEPNRHRRPPRRAPSIRPRAHQRPYVARLQFPSTFQSCSTDRTSRRAQSSRAKSSRACRCKRT